MSARVTPNFSGVTHRSTAVVAQPVSVVESNLWNVQRWHEFLGEVLDVVQEGPQRYVFTLAHPRGPREVRVSVRHHPRDRSFLFRSLGDLTWDGEIELRPMNGRRTRITLRITSLAPRRSGWLQPGPQTEQAHEDLARIVAFFERLPQPVRPARWGVEDEERFTSGDLPAPAARRPVSVPAAEPEAAEPGPEFAVAAADGGGRGPRHLAGARLHVLAHPHW